MCQALMIQLFIRETGHVLMGSSDRYEPTVTPESMLDCVECYGGKVLMRKYWELRSEG